MSTQQKNEELNVTQLKEVLHLLKKSNKSLHNMNDSAEKIGKSIDRMIARMTNNKI